MILSTTALTRRVRPSSLERTERCPWSAAGVGVDTTGVWAERGTGVHAYLVDAHRMGRDVALARIPHTAPHRRLAERLQLDRLPWSSLPAGVEVHFERSLAYSPATGHGRVSDRGALAGDEIGGTPDVVIVHADRVDVYDAKTGDPTNVQRPDENRQLHAYAAMAAAAYGRPVARVAITHVYEDGYPLTVQAEQEIDGIALLEFRARLVSVLARVDDAIRATDPRPYLARGPWCRYCPRFTECPAQLAVLHALVGAVRSGERPQIGVDHVADAREFLRDAKKWCDELDTVIKDYARVAPIPTAKPGVVYREVAGSKREIVDDAKAISVLRERFGDDVAAAATRTQTSAGAIDDAVAEWARRGGQKIGRAQEDAWKALRAAGAAVDASTSKVMEKRIEAA